jgi:hypothetical protein
MTRKIVGTILLIAGGMLAVVLFTNGMLFFPHIIGPGGLAVIGVILLAIKGKVDRSTK